MLPRPSLPAACISTDTPVARSASSSGQRPRQRAPHRGSPRRPSAPRRAPASCSSCSSSSSALDAQAEADRRRGLAAELLEQAVVAPAAAHRALRAQLVGDPLEHREVVVVHAAHQARVDAVGSSPTASSTARTASKCASELAPRKSISFGARLDQRLHRRVLGVQDAQRVAVQAAARVVVEPIGVLLRSARPARRGAPRARRAGPGC